MNSENSPVISVIIPAYNYASFLPQAIGSVSSQTYQNWECIVVDDGSTDNTKDVMEQLMKEDKRIHYFVQVNSGPTVARNLGLSKAKGKYIQFLDADDLIEDQKFQKQLDVFEKYPDIDIVYGNVQYFKSNNISKQYHNITLEGSKPWMKKLSGSGEEMIKALLYENLMVIQSPLFKRSLVQNFGNMDEKLYYNEDWELWARYAINNAKFKFDEAKGTNALVRVHDSYSKDNLMMFIYGLYACLKLDKSLEDKKYKKIMIPKIAYHKRIIDEKLIAILRTDKEAAVAKAIFIEKLTGVSRYGLYSRSFMKYPVWFCHLYSRFLFVIHKLKNMIIYA